MFLATEGGSSQGGSLLSVVDPLCWIDLMLNVSYPSGMTPAVFICAAIYFPRQER